MYKWIIAVVLMFVVGLQIGIKTGRASEQREMQPVFEAGIERVEEVRAEIAKYRLMMEIVACESSFNHKAVGDGGKAYGLAQFHKPTFYRMAKKAGYDGEWKSSKYQITLLKWAVDNGYTDEWSCGDKEGVQWDM